MNIKTDISLHKYLASNDDLKLFTAGNEHYSLLSMVSHEYNNAVIYDIGTYKGLSALALSSNSTNKIISYDIGYFVTIQRPTNVEFRIGDVYNDGNIFKSPLIMLDVDPHDGIYETNFINYLSTNNYKGIVVCDDIHLNTGMKQFWNSVQQEKIDYTNVGHWSGTGAILFK
jgi:hypothetical protein